MEAYSDVIVDPGSLAIGRAHQSALFILSGANALSLGEALPKGFWFDVFVVPSSNAQSFDLVLAAAGIDAARNEFEYPNNNTGFSYVADSSTGGTVRFVKVSETRWACLQASPNVIFQAHA